MEKSALGQNRWENLYESRGDSEWYRWKHAKAVAKEIKAKIKSIQMQMARQRMMSAVPQADVVVTNPTHYDVAIQYDKSKAPAPISVTLSGIVPTDSSHSHQ